MAPPGANASLTQLPIGGAPGCSQHPPPPPLQLIDPNLTGVIEVSCETEPQDGSTGLTSACCAGPVTGGNQAGLSPGALWELPTWELGLTPQTETLCWNNLSPLKENSS